MEVLEENIKYSFSKPILYKMNNGRKWEVHINYKLDGKRLKLRDSRGLNEAKYFVTLEDLLLKGRTKRQANKIIENLNIERLKEADNTINDYLKDIKSSPFYPELKVFGIPSIELALVSYYEDFIDYKTKDRIKGSSIKQYESKYKLFKEYLALKKQTDITVKNADKHLYISYFQYLTANMVSDSYYNDLLNFHRMVWNYIIDIKEQNVKSPLKVIKSITLNESEKHQIIKLEYIAESFVQLENYGSRELMLICKFIFYTLHRPDTLVKLQLSDFDLTNGTLHIPANKIKTGKSITIRLHSELSKIIKDYIADNEVAEKDYLLGYSMVESVRGTKRKYQLFGSIQADRQDYTLKFRHFRDEQIVKAYALNKGLIKLFTKNQNLYGYKHTSVVFLKSIKWDIEQIMDYTGHKKTEIAEIYARQYKPVLPEFPTP